MSRQSRRREEPLGTPIAALAMDDCSPRREDVMDEEKTPFEDLAEDDQVFSSSQRSRGPPVVELAQKLAWFAAKMAVVKPLRATAPFARACAYLTVEQLIRLLPDLPADVAVAAGSFAAKSAKLVTESREGVAAISAAEDLVKNVLDCACTEEGETFVFDSAESIAKFVKVLKSKPAMEFYDALERAAHAGLKVAGSPEAALVVSDCRATVDAVVDLLGSDASLAAIDEAANGIADALQTRRRQQKSPPDLDETLSECDSETDDTPTPAARKKKPPPTNPFTSPEPIHFRPTRKRKVKRSSQWQPLLIICAIFGFASWTAVAIFGYLVVTNRFPLHLSDNDPTPFFDPSAYFPIADAPRPLKACSFDDPVD